MKLTFRQIEPFVQNPDPKARVILVYGPDQGLMKERTTAICKTAVADLNDPFNVVQFTTEKIIADQAAFFDETQSQSLMGGDRLIIIKDGSDSLSPTLKEYLESPSDQTLVVVEAGNLGPKSSLRKLCESAKNAAAVPCYVDDEQNLSHIIRDMVQHAGYGIDRDALLVFSSALVGDRSVARGEIEKLLLYKGLAQGYEGFSGEPVRQKLGNITMDDVTATCGDIRDWSMDKLVYAVGDGDVKAVSTIIESLFRDHVAPIICLRSTQNHFWQLYTTNAKIAAGMSMTDAVGELSPPLFFKVQDAFKRQLNRWPLSALENALDTLNKTEAMTKKTGYSDTALCKSCLIRLARYNPRRMAA